MSIEKPPQNYPEALNTSIDKRILEQKKADMQDLFYSSDLPLDIIITEMQTDEFKSVEGKDVADKTIEKLQSIIYEDEDVLWLR